MSCITTLGVSISTPPSYVMHPLPFSNSIVLRLPCCCLLLVACCWLLVAGCKLESWSYHVVVDILVPCWIICWSDDQKKLRHRCGIAAQRLLGGSPNTNEGSRAACVQNKLVLDLPHQTGFMRCLDPRTVKDWGMTNAVVTHTHWQNVMVECWESSYVLQSFRLHRWLFQPATWWQPHSVISSGPMWSSKPVLQGSRPDLVVSQSLTECLMIHCPGTRWRRARWNCQGHVLAVPQSTKIHAIWPFLALHTPLTLSCSIALTLYSSHSAFIDQ